LRAHTKFSHVFNTRTRLLRLNPRLAIVGVLAVLLRSFSYYYSETSTPNYILLHVYIYKEREVEPTEVSTVAQGRRSTKTYICVRLKSQEILPSYKYIYI